MIKHKGCGGVCEFDENMKKWKCLICEEWVDEYEVEK